MKSILNIVQIWFCELRSISKDEGILIFILFVPLAYPLLYSFVYTNEVVREVPVTVVDECNNALSRDYIRKIDATPDVNVVAHCPDMAQAKKLLTEQKAFGIINIPSSFSSDLTHGEQTHVGVYCDMGKMLNYKAIVLAATNVSQEINKDIKVSGHLPATTRRQEEITKMPVEYEHIPLYNPQSGFAAFLIPPVLMLIIQQTLFLGIGMSTGDSREKYMGSVIPFNRCYKNPVHIVLGKTLPYFLLYILLSVYMFAVVNRLFILPALGDYLTFIAFMVPYLLACILMGIVLSFLVYRREDCIMLFVFLSVPLLFLSGLSYPGSSIPQFWKYVSCIFPSTFGMNGYVRITATGASLQDVHTEFCALWIQTGIYFITACLFYRHQIVSLVGRVRPAVHA